MIERIRAWWASLHICDREMVDWDNCGRVMRCKVCGDIRLFY